MVAWPAAWEKTEDGGFHCSRGMDNGEILTTVLFILHNQEPSNFINMKIRKLSS